MTRTKSNSSTSTAGPGAFDSDTFWGRIMPEPLIIDRHLPFEERVERAWQRLVNQFHEEEQAEMRAMLIDIITTCSHLVPRIAPKDVA